MHVESQEDWSKAGIFVIYTILMVGQLFMAIESSRLLCEKGLVSKVPSISLPSLQANNAQQTHCLQMHCNATMNDLLSGLSCLQSCTYFVG